MIDKVPQDIIIEVSYFLTSKNLFNLSVSCKGIYKILDNDYWHRRCVREFIDVSDIFISYKQLYLENSIYNFYNYMITSNFYHKNFKEEKIKNIISDSGSLNTYFLQIDDNFTISQKFIQYSYGIKDIDNVQLRLALKKYNSFFSNLGIRSMSIYSKFVKYNMLIVDHSGLVYTLNSTYNLIEKVSNLSIFVKVACNYTAGYLIDNKNNLWKLKDKNLTFFKKDVIDVICNDIYTIFIDIDNYLHYISNNDIICFREFKIKKVYLYNNDIYVIRINNTLWKKNKSLNKNNKICFTKILNIQIKDFAASINYKRRRYDGIFFYDNLYVIDCDNNVLQHRSNQPVIRITNSRVECNDLFIKVPIIKANKIVCCYDLLIFNGYFKKYI